MVLWIISFYFFLCFTGAQSLTFASWVDAHDDATGHDNSTYSSPNRAILALTKKAKEVREQGFYEDAIKQLAPLFLAAEQPLKGRVCLPSKSQITAIITRMTPPDFIDHAGLLLAHAGKPLTPLEILFHVEKVSACYIEEQLLSLYPTMEPTGLKKIAFIIHVSLTGALIKASAQAL
jgi:hypothetical protein